MKTTFIKPHFPLLGYTITSYKTQGAIISNNIIVKIYAPIPQVK